MKKLLTLLLLVLYTLGVSGARVQLRYCCGQLADVRLQLQPGQAACPHQTMDDGGACCQYDQVTLQVDDEQGSSHAAPVPAASQVVMPDRTPLPAPKQCATAALPGVLHSRGSPPPQHIPLFLLHQVFRN